jgi:hypothetical protein
VKSTVYSEAELETLALWAMCVTYEIDIHRPSVEFTEYAELGYYKLLNQSSRWRLRKGIEQALLSAIGLGTSCARVTLSALVAPSSGVVPRTRSTSSLRIDWAMLLTWGVGRLGSSAILA